jgi:hypothetical protein
VSFVGKSISEQRVEYFETLKRPLTDNESEELRKAMHAAYCYRRRANDLKAHRAEELKLLKRVEREARMRSDLG